MQIARFKNPTSYRGTLSHIPDNVERPTAAPSHYQGPTPLNRSGSVISQGFSQKARLPDSRRPAAHHCLAPFAELRDAAGVCLPEGRASATCSPNEYKCINVEANKHVDAQKRGWLRNLQPSAILDGCNLSSRETLAELLPASSEASLWSFVSITVPLRSG